MKPAQRAGGRVPGHALLDKGGIQAVPRKLFLAHGAGEEAALVRAWFEIDQPGAGQRGRGEFQETISTCGIGMTNCPPQARIAVFWRMISSLMFQGRISR